MLGANRHVLTWKGVRGVYISCYITYHHIEAYSVASYQLTILIVKSLA